MDKKIEFFLKVTKTEYINNLTKQGFLYLTLAEEFRNRKRFGGKKYDTEEGRLSKQYKMWIDLGKNDFKDPHTILDVSNGKIEGGECVYCLKAIFREEINRKGIIVPYEFLNDLIDTDNWSEYSLLLIKNVDGFLDCVEQSAQKYDYSYLFKLVQYDNHFFECDNPLISDEAAKEIYFHKREKFKEQSEYRILLQNDRHEDLKIEIGTDFFTIENYIQVDNLQSFKTGKPLLLI